MTQRNHSLKRVLPFAAGVLIGVSIVTPVFAATLDIEEVQPYLLLGSLIVLLIGLILKAMTARSSTRVNAQGSAADRPDMRRQETYSTIDIAMPVNAIH
jgi:hypothetical protein